MEEIKIKKKYCEDVNLALWVANAVSNEPLTGATVDVVVLGRFLDTFVKAAQPIDCLSLG